MSEQKTAIITGISGQDGAYLAKLLLSKGYKVIGLVRSINSSNKFNLDYLNIKSGIVIEECDLLDLSQILNLLKIYEPDEFYNLAAQSSVSQSFKQPIGTINFNIKSVINALEAIKIINNKIKYYQASSSEMFGKVESLPVTESTRIHPLSPYAISKASAHWITINYRESYNLFACCGILFNHESYLRRSNFFIKKVIRESLKIKKGEAYQLTVGNVEIKRDFGYAPKYVEAIWKILQQDSAQEFIICSGSSIKLKDIILYIFNKLNIPENKLNISQELYRPTEIEDMYGDNEKAKKVLKWDYDINFYEVLDILIEEEESNMRD